MTPLDDNVIASIIEECNGYKHMKGVPCFEGWKKGEHTVEHLTNMSAAASKRVRSAEHIAALHAGRRNSKNSNDHKQKLIQSRLGSKHSDAAKAVMSAKKKKAYENGTLWTAQTKQKLKVARAARNTPEYKKQQSEKMKAIWDERRSRVT